MSAERVVGIARSRYPQAVSGEHRRRSACSAFLLAALVASAGSAVGCKSGGSMMTMPKPSWWSFGGSGDSEKLASAPSFSTDAKKPSETNTPYPTTSTPNGYVITGSSSAGSSPAAQAAAPIGPVVYGSTPAPVATATAPGTASAAASAAAAPPAGGVAAQTGPYASLAGDTIPPPGQPLPPLAPLSSAATAPASAAMPSLAGPAAAADAPAAGLPSYRAADATAAPRSSNFSADALPPAAAEPPAARMADARGGDASGGLQPGLPGGDSGAAAYDGGRYGAQSASRFTGGGPTVASPASFGQPAADAAFPPADAALPSNSPPAGAPVMQPGSPGLLPQTSPQPPVRRPDPGYRPFKTGSYRPSRTILADEPAPPSGDVRTASYEEAAGTLQR